MTGPFERAAAHDVGIGFLEDPKASLPVDRAASLQEGALSGITVGVKANIRVEGQAWTAGIEARQGARAMSDAAVVAALRAAGATILSRLKMDEGALGAATDPPHFGRCENPAAPGRSPGGSSGGSAAAVAAAAVDVALGTDTLGSVRIPAAYCGIWGLKLTPGAVPMDGVFPLAPRLDALGLLAAEPNPMRAVLDVLTPDVAPPPLVAWARGPDAGTTPDVAAFMARCADALTVLLGPPRPLRLPDLAALRRDAFLLTEVEAAVSLKGEPGLSNGLRKLVDYGAGLGPDRRAAVAGRLDTVGAELRAALAGSTALLLPTVAAPAFWHDTPPPRGQADFTALANVAGCPALAFPCPDSDPPVSVQFVGPPGSERSLLVLAERLLARSWTGPAGSLSTP